MLRGKLTYLTELCPYNLETLRRWRNNPDLRKYFREHRIISDEMQKEWYERVRKDPNQYNFEINVNNAAHRFGSLAGHCGLYYIDWIARSAEFGIYIAPKLRRKGLGSDALKTLLSYGFEDLNLNRIWCEVYSNNEALNIYKHLGFIHEGTLRQSYYNEGKYWDSHMLSMLKEEWDGSL